MVKGRVKEWRIQRDNAWLIHASFVPEKDRVNKLLYLPLPYDDELEEIEKKEMEKTISESERVYIEATGQTYESFILKQKKNGLITDN